MAGLFTYNDFRDAATKAGLMGNFTAADLKLAESNPDAGMSLLQSKLDYGKATTPEAKALANASAEKTRKDSGGYTAGKSGDGYYISNDKTPSSFVAAPTPAFSSDKTATKDSLLNDLISMPQFQYDAETDPVAQSYAKQYQREGKRAIEDTLGSAAGMTGGIPSSYAVSAAAQAGNNYAAALSDKQAELYEQAYNRYYQEYQRKLGLYDTVSSAENNDYARYIDDVNRQNADRSFEYQKALDQNNYDNNERAYADSRDDEEFNRQYQLAQLGGSYGDYGGIKALGINPDFSAISAASGSGTASETDTTAKFDSTQYKNDLEVAKGLDAQTGGHSYTQSVYDKYISGYYGGTPGALGDVTQVTDDQADAILSKYPDKVVTNDADWNSLKNYFHATDLQLKQNGWNHQRIAADDGGRRERVGELNTIKSGKGTYDIAVKYLKGKGASQATINNLLTEAEWNSGKKAGKETAAYAFNDTYADYLDTYVGFNA